MKQNNLKSCIRKPTHQKKRAVAEVISSLLLVAITVAGAIILTVFLNDSFLQGGLAVSGSESTVKSIKLISYDTRDGTNLLGFTNLNNTIPVDLKLCRNSCNANPNLRPSLNGTEFLVIQIENRSVNPIFLHNVWLSNVTHSWDRGTAGKPLIPTGSSPNGDFPVDGTFSILPHDFDANKVQQDLTQQVNQIESGQTVNLLIKLDSVNPDIPISKTIRAQFNIGSNQLSEVLIEIGGAQ